MNANRARLLAVIAEEPGLAFRAVCRRADLAVGTARHHLNVLIRRESIWTTRLENRELHFPGPRPREAVAASMLRDALLDELDRDILRLLPSSQKPVLDALQERGVARSTTQHRLERLVRRGLVSKSQHGRRVLYDVCEATPQWTTQGAVARPARLVA